MAALNIKNKQKDNKKSRLFVPFFEYNPKDDDALSQQYLKELGDGVELELDPRWNLLVGLWEALLQDRRQGDERHRAVEVIPVDKNL